jgi:hypothetical protein
MNEEEETFRHSRTAYRRACWRSLRYVCTTCLRSLRMSGGSRPASTNRSSIRTPRIAAACSTSSSRGGFSCSRSTRNQYGLDAQHRVSSDPKGHAGTLARNALHHRRRVIPVHQRLRALVGRISRPPYSAPLQIGSCGPTDIRERAREILALTKMNWNSSEGIGRHPITISFARKVGMLMTELSDNQVPNPSYGFYM